MDLEWAEVAGERAFSDFRTAYLQGKRESNAGLKNVDSFEVRTGKDVLAPSCTGGSGQCEPVTDDVGKAFYAGVIDDMRRQYDLDLTEVKEVA